MIWRLSSGRAGEEVVSDARDYPVFDPRAGAGTAARVALAVVVLAGVLAIAGTAIDPDHTLSADLQAARTLLDL
jgi:hypothetical protein